MSRYRILQLLLHRTIAMTILCHESYEFWCVNSKIIKFIFLLTCILNFVQQFCAEITILIWFDQNQGKDLNEPYDPLNDECEVPAWGILYNGGLVCDVTITFCIHTCWDRYSIFLKSVSIHWCKIKNSTILFIQNNPWWKDLHYDRIKICKY